MAAAQGFEGLKGMDLAKEVTVKEAYDWTGSTWDLETGHSEKVDGQFKVVAYDYGVKRNILRMLVERGCNLTVVPAQTPAKDVLAMNPDGVFLSNGPGDPEPCDYAIAAIKEILTTDTPFWYLFRAPTFGFSKWGENRKNEIWTSWCQPPCS